MKKVIAYIDIDNTLSFKEKTTKSIQLEAQAELGTPAECVRNFFGYSYISRERISALQALKKQGVELVCVTDRHFLDTDAVIDSLLNSFSKVYCSCGTVCYDPITKEVDQAYTEYVKGVIALRDKKREVALEILAESGIDDYLDNTLVIYIRKDRVSPAVLEHLKEELAAADIPFSDSIFFEIRLVSTNKGEVIKWDLASRKDHSDLTICMGDALTDYTMLPYCSIGIFPQSLITNYVSKLSFVCVGSAASKLIVMPEDTWRIGNVKELVKCVEKFYKHAV